jgi:hypothetical protein
MVELPWLKDLAYLHVSLHPGYIGDHGRQDATDAFWTLAKHVARTKVLGCEDPMEIYQNMFRVLTTGNHAIGMYPTPNVLRILPDDLEIPTYIPPPFAPMSISELQTHFSMGEQRPVLPPPINRYPTRPTLPTLPTKFDFNMDPKIGPLIMPDYVTDPGPPTKLKKVAQRGRGKCENCRQAKTKCVGGSPCVRCVGWGLEGCIWKQNNYDIV